MPSLQSSGSVPSPELAQSHSAGSTCSSTSSVPITYPYPYWRERRYPPPVRFQLRTVSAVRRAAVLGSRDSRSRDRVDAHHAPLADFYSQRVGRSTGTIVDSFGNLADLAIVENTNDLKRRYSGGTTTATYRFNARSDIGGNYTLARLWGDFDGDDLPERRQRPAGHDSGRVGRRESVLTSQNTATLARCNPLTMRITRTAESAVRNPRSAMWSALRNLFVEQR